MFVCLFNLRNNFAILNQFLALRDDSFILLTNDSLNSDFDFLIAAVTSFLFFLKFNQARSELVNLAVLCERLLCLMSFRILDLNQGTSFSRIFTSLFGIDNLAALVMTSVNDLAV